MRINAFSTSVCYGADSVGVGMESDLRLYIRRVAEELRAAERAFTSEAKARRLALAGNYAAKVHELESAAGPTGD